MASRSEEFAKNEKLKILFRKYKSLSFGCGKIKTSKYKTKQQQQQKTHEISMHFFTTFY